MGQQGRSPCSLHRIGRRKGEISADEARIPVQHLVLKLGERDGDAVAICGDLSRA